MRGARIRASVSCSAAVCPSIESIIRAFSDNLKTFDARSHKPMRPTVAGVPMGAAAGMRRVRALLPRG